MILALMSRRFTWSLAFIIAMIHINVAIVWALRGGAASFVGLFSFDVVVMIVVTTSMSLAWVIL